MNVQAQAQKTAQIKCGKEGCGQVFVEVPLDNKYYPGLSMYATVLRQAHFKTTGHEGVISTEPKYVSATLVNEKISLVYSKVITS